MAFDEMNEQNLLDSNLFIERKTKKKKRGSRTGTGLKYIICNYLHLSQYSILNFEFEFEFEL